LIKTCKKCGTADWTPGGRCRPCARAHSAKWLKDNPDKARAHNTKWRLVNTNKAYALTRKWEATNSDRVRATKARWEANHPTYYADYIRNRCKADVRFRLRRNLRERLRQAIKGNFKTGSAVADLGCSIPELKLHLENQFQPGMSWENYGEWHIDHIRPLASFDLADREQFLQACHFSNLQPLWEEDNRKKADKYLPS